MKLALKSRESTFFDLLNRHVAVVQRSAVELRNLFSTFQGLDERSAAIRFCALEGSQCVRQMTTDLSKAFVTPMDREDLHQLASSLQRVLGYVDGTVRKLPIYRINKTNDAATRQADVLVRMTDVLVKGFGGLSQFTDCSPWWNEVKSLEHEGDLLLAAAVADMFEDGTDVLEVIKWKEIHEDLEEAIERAEDVFDVLETALVKHS